MDIFLYDEDDDYVWAVTGYTLAHILYRKDDVFPLGRAEFDGKLYPVPRLTDKLVRAEFGALETCVSPNHLHRFNRPLEQKDVVRMPCKDLEHMYPMTYFLHTDQYIDT